MVARPMKKLENFKEQKRTSFSWASLLQHFLPINRFSNLGVLRQVCSLESPEELKLHLVTHW